MYRNVNAAGEFLLKVALFVREEYLMLAFSVFDYTQQRAGCLLGQVGQNLWILLLCPFCTGPRYLIPSLFSISPTLHLLFLSGTLVQSSHCL